MFGYADYPLVFPLPGGNDNPNEPLRGLESS